MMNQTSKYQGARSKKRVSMSVSKNSKNHHEDTKRRNHEKFNSFIHNDLGNFVFPIFRAFVIKKVVFGQSHRIVFSSILATLFSLLLFGTIQAEEYSKPVGWVNDFAGVISPEYKSQLTNLIAEIERKTGAEIAIATVKTTHPQSIDMYAVELFTRWGIGKKGKDNGVLIVAAIDDRKVWIETGYGLEGILPDGLCGEIYRKVLQPNFKQGEFGKGLLLATAVIAKKIGEEYNVAITGTERAPQISYGRKSRARMLFPLLFFLLIFSGRLFLPLLLMGGMRGGYWGSGTFGGGGGFGGGFGGFGGGSCGGGGAGGGW